MGNIFLKKKFETAFYQFMVRKNLHNMVIAYLHPIRLQLRITNISISKWISF